MPQLGDVKIQRLQARVGLRLCPRLDKSHLPQEPWPLVPFFPVPRPWNGSRDRQLGLLPSRGTVSSAAMEEGAPYILQDDRVGSRGQAEGWGTRGSHVKTEGKWSAQQTERNLGCFLGSSAGKRPRNTLKSPRKISEVSPKRLEESSGAIPKVKRKKEECLSLWGKIIKCVY